MREKRRQTATTSSKRRSSSSIYLKLLQTYSWCFFQQRRSDRSMYCGSAEPFAHHDCSVCLLDINKSVGIGKLCLTVWMILLSQSKVSLLHLLIAALITYTKDFIAALHLCAIHQRKPLTHSERRTQTNRSAVKTTLRPRKTKEKTSRSFHHSAIKDETECYENNNKYYS